MKSQWLLFLGLACLLTGGCCGVRQQQIAALERENSQLNGRLWEMQFQLESLEDENCDLKRSLATSEIKEEDSTSHRPKRIERESEEAEPFDPGQFRPPVIEFPSEPAPEGTVPDTLLPGGNVMPGPGDSSTRRESATSVSVTSHEEPAPPDPKIEIVPPEEVSLDSTPIQRIELATLIGTLHLDDKAGDDGLVVVVEPWDGKDQMLAAAADVAVALIDPVEPAETARFAQWRFEARETAKLFRDGDLPGLHLELPWPDEPPRHDRLHLFVRYTTSDGRKLETDSVVEVELGGRGRWIATDLPRVRPYEQSLASLESGTAAPQLLPALNELPAEEADSSLTGTPVRTVSSPRVRISDSRLSHGDDGKGSIERSSRPKTEFADGRRGRTITPARESDPAAPTRNRPAWSPDRPW